jgi:hypothetical protein
MSAKGQKRTHAVQHSGSPLDRYVSETKQSRRHFNADRLDGFGINVRFRPLHNAGVRVVKDENEVRIADIN